MDGVLVELLLRGVMLGSLYALIGVGLSIAFGIMKVINVAHGDLAILCAYISLAMLTFLKIPDPLITLLLIAPLAFVMGFALQKFIINRVMKAGINQPVIATFALSIIIQNLLLLIFTSDARSLVTAFWLKSLQVGEVTISLRYLLAFAFSIAVFVILNVFLRRTYLGKAMRATPYDLEGARIVGINPEFIYNFAMGISVMTAALAGVLLGIIFTFYPTTGPNFLLIAFAVVVLGGLGNLNGTILGGVILGITQLMAGYFLGSQYQLVVCYLVALIFLVIRPQGLLGVKTHGS